jgi:RNA polymerase sigma factor (sigma-70 family)
VLRPGEVGTPTDDGSTSITVVALGKDLRRGRGIPTVPVTQEGVSVHGEIGSFELFYRDGHPRVVATLILALGDVDAARDAAADAFTKALVDWPRVSGLRSPMGWTYTVALNAGRRTHRRRLREAELLSRFPPAPAVTELPEPVSAVWGHLDRLPERQRLAVVLRYAADLTEADVAAVMGIRRSTVSSTLAAAHRTLGRFLADDEPADRRLDASLPGDRHG